MWYKTDTMVVSLIRKLIQVSVDPAPLIFVSYYNSILSSKDTNNTLNVTMPEQI